MQPLSIHEFVMKVENVEELISLCDSRRDFSINILCFFPALFSYVLHHIRRGGEENSILYRLGLPNSSTFYNGAQKTAEAQWPGGSSTALLFVCRRWYVAVRFVACLVDCFSACLIVFV